MAIKSKTICDRCGAEIPNRLKYPILRLTKRTQKLKYKKLLSDDPYDYYDKKIDLCHDCQVSFESWLYGEDE